MSVGTVVLFPLTLASNVFVSPQTMPGWLQAFVDVNQVSHLVTAERGLMAGQAGLGEVAWVLLAAAALAAVFAPLTAWLERPRCDTLAHRRCTMSRCHRTIVAGVTISHIPARRSMGGVPASRASHVRSGHVSLRSSAGPLAQGDSELMAQHQDLGVLPPLLPARQPEQRHGTGYGQEDQRTSGRPKTGSSALDAGPRSAERLPADDTPTGG